MLCQICKKRPAAISYTQVINQKKTQLSLCVKCAEEKGITNPLAGLPEMFGEILAHILGEEPFLEAEAEASGKSARRCPGCNRSFSDFEKTGLLGCDECYQTFEKELAILLRRIHGSNKHIGSRPRPRRAMTTARDLVKLRKELEEAIHKEKFERAAELRDLIRDAEREANHKTPARNRKQAK
ncbi:MAG: UvrB/UvrC motif-containing protein [candidate division KSB1 bacterium]|nr:UvrB/UvrC motif-containing protein [candidate division KSB1 bacterium]MDZ7304435.1 UvrB/UvrC motif-containing protein [candidate division KSB1 bacterium]MDZ7310928.1 UvrB/UvrC motif-containing protein [candidate division KSB1 bacterium]